MLLIRNQKQFESIFNEYWEDLYRSAYLRLKDQAVTEDIVQEVFVDLWQRRERIEIQSSLKAYLLTAVKYRVLKHFNQQAKFRIEGLDKAEMVTDDGDEMAFEDLYKNIEVAIDKLSPKCRLIFRMSKIEGLSTDEIARQLNLSKQTVHNQLSKSMGLVRAEMKHMAPLLLMILEGHA